MRTQRPAIRRLERAPRVIRVSVESAQPLTGTAAVEPGRQVRFEGWLGLLGVLAELVGSPVAHDHRGPEAANGTP